MAQLVPGATQTLSVQGNPTPPPDFSGAAQIFATAMQMKVEQKRQKDQDAIKNFESMVNIMNTPGGAGLIDQDTFVKTSERAQKALSGTLGKDKSSSGSKTVADLTPAAKATGGNGSGAQAANPATPANAKAAPGGGVGTDYITNLKQSQEQAQQLTSLHQSNQIEEEKAVKQINEMINSDDPSKKYKGLVAQAAHTGQPVDEKVAAGLIMDMSPSQQKDAIERATKVDNHVNGPKREQELTKTLLADDRFAPADVPKVAKALANGEPIPSDVKIKRSMMEYAAIGNQASELVKNYPGLDTKQAYGAAEAAATTSKSISEYLPTGLKSYGSSQLELQGKELAIRKEEKTAQLQHYKAEEAHWAADDRAKLKAQKSLEQPIGADFAKRTGLPESTTWEQAYKYSQISNLVAKDDTLSKQVDNLLAMSKTMKPGEAAKDPGFKAAYDATVKAIANKAGVYDMTPKERSHWYEAVGGLLGLGVGAFVGSPVMGGIAGGAIGAGVRYEMGPIEEGATPQGKGVDMNQFTGAQQ